MCQDDFDTEKADFDQFDAKFDNFENFTTTAWFFTEKFCLKAAVEVSKL